MNTKEEKAALRRLWREKRESLPPDVRSERDTRLCRVVSESASYRYAECLLAYAPVGCEIDVFPLVRLALAEGRRVALPRTHGGGVMTFHYISSEEELILGNLGIREPQEDAPLFGEFPLALCLVPGIVYDRSGLRIGYGGGYYDRFLRDREIATLGIVYRDFILPSLPGGRYDQRVAALATERGILPTQP